MPRDGSGSIGSKAPKCARPQIAQELVDFVNHSWTQFHAVGEMPRHPSHLYKCADTRTGNKVLPATPGCCQRSWT